MGLSLNKINLSTITSSIQKQVQKFNLNLKKPLVKDVFEFKKIIIDPITKKQTLTPEMFFINVEGYGKDIAWAEKIAQAVEETSTLVNKKTNFGALIDAFIEKTKEAQGEVSLYLKENYGVLRNPKMDGYDNDLSQIETFLGNKYMFFYDKLKQAGGGETIYNKTSAEFPQALTSKVYIFDGLYKDVSGLLHPSSCDNLLYAQDIYQNLIKKTNPTEKEITESAAKIHWLIAQNTPWMRGSDTIANGIIKSILRAYDIQISPLKKGISIDFEAFSRDMEDFVQNYSSFYQVKPKKINPGNNNGALMQK